jgi:Fic family protein
MAQKSKTSAMRNSVWRPDQPFDRIPLLPPPSDLETKAILKHCIKARAAVAELKQAAELIPNQAVLIKTLPLLEAQASSEIENIVTSADRLFQFRAGDENADPATKEALRYSQALLEGYQTLKDRPLSTGTAEKICSTIKGTEMRVRRVPGTTLANARTGEVVYTPPVGEEHLRSLLANWERFIHGSEEIDPLIRMAVMHYQFEAIHPFTDGNGRTGRVLNSLFLIEAGLLTLPILYLSRYIIHHRSDYYRLLIGVTRDEAWEPWILYFLKGVEETAVWTQRKIEAMRKLALNTAEYFRKALPKIYSRELVDLLFEQPYCRIQNLTQAGLAERHAASRYLKSLVGIGILEERVVGRERLFVNSRLLKLLTEERNDFPPYLEVVRKSSRRRG